MMIEINILASGSNGNCYVISDDEKKIMIDPGIKIREIRRKCNFNLATLDFCLVSHEHKDHCRSVKDIASIGVLVAMSKGTMKHFVPNNSLYMLLESNIMWSFKGWKILPFDVEHDAEEPLGFLIRTPSGKKIMFATDTYYIRYRFANVAHYLVECNYSEKLLEENEELPDIIKTRIRTSHFELENVKRFFQAQDLSKTEKIYLIHLSDDNSDRENFVKQIKSVTGKIVV